MRFRGRTENKPPIDSGHYCTVSFTEIDSLPTSSIMQSPLLVNRIFLSSVAFGVSLGLGLLATRNVRQALLTGVITVPASYVGAVVAEKRRANQEQLLRSSLHHQIQALEGQQSLLQQSLYAATVTRQEVEASINALQTERSHLLNRVSELHNQRNVLYQEVNEFQQQKQQFEGEVYRLHSQVQHLETEQAELNQSLTVKTSQIQQRENRLNLLREELEQLQIKLSERQQLQENYAPDLNILQRQKQNLEGELYDLRTQIQALEQRREQLNQTLVLLAQDKQDLEKRLTSRQTELEQILKEVSDKHQQQEQLKQDLVSLENQKQQIEGELYHLQTQLQEEQQKITLPSATTQEFVDEVSPIIIPEEWREWFQFTQQLTPSEQMALKVILEQDRVALKKVADEHSTMPEVLIDSINEKALNTFGDTLFLGQSSSGIPTVSEDYSTIFLEPISLHFKDLLNLNPSHNASVVTVEQEAIDTSQNFEVIVPQRSKWRCLHTLDYATGSVIMSHDGRTIISGGKDGNIKLWDGETGALISTLLGHSSAVDAMAIAPDHQTIASGSEDSTIKLWQLNTGELLHTFTGHTSSVRVVAISADGKFLASGGDDQSIQLWDLKKKTLIRHLQGVSSSVTAIDFSPRTRQKILAAGLQDGQILQWDLKTDTPPTILLRNSHRIAGLKISPDGNTVIIGDAEGMIKVLNLYVGVAFASFATEQGGVLSLALSPDGKTLLSAGNGIKLWNLETRGLLETFSEHSDSVCAVAFGSSHEMFVSSSHDGTIKIWQHT